MEELTIEHFTDLGFELLPKPQLLKYTWHFQMKPHPVFQSVTSLDVIYDTPREGVQDKILRVILNGKEESHLLCGAVITTKNELLWVLSRMISGIIGYFPIDLDSNSVRSDLMLVSKAEYTNLKCSP